MESVIDKNRLGRAAEIAHHVDPSFLSLAPTIRFPLPVFAHDQLGMCVIIVRDDVLLRDAATGQWFTAGVSFNAEEAADEAEYDLAVAAKAPRDRITSVVWLPSGINPDLEQSGGPVVVGMEPAAVAAFVEDRMRRALSGSNEPTSPWLGTYVAASVAPRDKSSKALKRFVSALKFSLQNRLGDNPIVAYGVELGVDDLADPRFILPALLVSASEDWNLASASKPRGTGFDMRLESDPTSLLGYRVSDIKTAIPFTGIAPAVATAARTFDGEDFQLDDIIRQFGRWLEKLHLDGTILEDVELRLRTSA